jgi:hypothetical protein
VDVQLGEPVPLHYAGTLLDVDSSGDYCMVDSGASGTESVVAITFNIIEAGYTARFIVLDDDGVGSGAPTRLAVFAGEGFEQDRYRWTPAQAGASRWLAPDRVSFEAVVTRSDLGRELIVSADITCQGYLADP